ncbi:MAG: dihydrodipicolinate synthase family protein [Actinomycetota bacterium]|jgi:4-hydroxy-tetrahydrodipicolinate synthase|nr:dihydrodipicolinate synthase family protein [Actinomycetota bacterium]
MTKSEANLHGVFAASLTPMDESLNVDDDAFATHCRRLLLDAGCHGLAIFGTTGEANSLSEKEKVSALESLVEKGIPAEKLLAGTGACSVTETVRLTRAAIEAGTAGVLVLPPFYYKDVSDEGIFRYFSEAVERVADERMKLYLYHFPQMTGGVGFEIPLIERLIEAYPDTIVGMKDSEGNWARIEEICQTFPGFETFAGTERFLLDTLEAGGVGCISATTNLTSRLAREVYELHKDGEKDEARASQKHLTELRNTMEGFPAIPALKATMRHLTKEESWRNIRPPLVEMDEARTKKLLESLPEGELL